MKPSGRPVPCATPPRKPFLAIAESAAKAGEIEAVDRVAVEDELIEVGAQELAQGIRAAVARPQMQIAENKCGHGFVLVGQVIYDATITIAYDCEAS